MDAPFWPAIAAVATGDHDELRRLLAADPDLVHLRSSTAHPTLLQYVAVDGGLGTVPDPADAAAILLDAGAAPTTCEEGLVAAASTGCIPVIDLLLDRGVLVDARAPWTAAEEANYWNHGPVVEHLVERGAAVRSLRLAAGRGDLELLARMVPTPGAPTADAGIVVCPFTERYDPRTQSDPQHILDQAFVLALLNGQYAAADWLLANGADINGVPSGTHWAGAALHAIVDFDRPETATWLLERGASREVVDLEFHGTPQGRAQFQGRQHLVEMLAP